jgi:hypothetical protein
LPTIWIVEISYSHLSSNHDTQQQRRQSNTQHKSHRILIFDPTWKQKHVIGHFTEMVVSISNDSKLKCLEISLWKCFHCWECQQARKENYHRLHSLRR